MGQPDDRDKVAWLLSVSEHGEIFTCKKCGDLYAFPSEETRQELSFFRASEQSLTTLEYCGPCAKRASNNKRGFAPRVHFRGPNPWPLRRRAR